MNSNSPGSGLEPKPFVHFGVPNIVPERLTERVLVHWIPVLTVLNNYFHLNEFQSALLLIHLHQSMTQTYPRYDASSWRQARRSLTPLQKSRQNNLSFCVNRRIKVSDMVLVLVQELCLIVCTQPRLPVVRSHGGWFEVYLIAGPSWMNTNFSLSLTHWIPWDVLSTNVFPVRTLCQSFWWVSYWLVSNASDTLDDLRMPTW